MDFIINNSAAIGVVSILVLIAIIYFGYKDDYKRDKKMFFQNMVGLAVVIIMVIVLFKFNILGRLF